MRHVDTINGVLKATILAGPIFVATLAAAPALLDGAAITLDARLAIAPAILAVTIIPGAIVALGPVWLGTAIMAVLGRWNPALRHPAVWALAGGGAIGGWLPWQSAGAQALSFALTATGVGCALLSRSGVRWSG